MTAETPKTPKTSSPRPASAPAARKPRPAAAPPAAKITSATPAASASTSVARRSGPSVARDIGLDVRLPKTACHDPNCPFHGHLKVRGQVIEGVVVSDHMQGTVVVSRTVLRFQAKYERYEKRRRRYLVHSPPCLGVHSGRRVRIAETRPLAKNVSFVVVEDMGDARLGVRGEEAANATGAEGRAPAARKAEPAQAAKTAQERLDEAHGSASSRSHKGAP